MSGKFKVIRGRYGSRDREVVSTHETRKEANESALAAKDATLTTEKPYMEYYYVDGPVNYSRTISALKALDEADRMLRASMSDDDALAAIDVVDECTKKVGVAFWLDTAEFNSLSHGMAASENISHEFVGMIHSKHDPDVEQMGTEEEKCYQ